MKEGTIRKVVRKWCDGFGGRDYLFISGDDGEDIFARISDVHGTKEEKLAFLYPGNRVIYKTVTPKEKGITKQAVDIRVLKKPQHETGGRGYREVSLPSAVGYFR